MKNSKTKLASEGSPKHAGLMSSFLLNTDQIEKVRKGEYDSQFEKLKDFFAGDLNSRRNAAREAIEKFVVSGSPLLDASSLLALALSWEVSIDSLQNYATLNELHLGEIEKMYQAIYQYGSDPTLTRPLNFMMLASPGAGKSHFINCIARRLNAIRVSPTSFNMASMGSPEDLITPLDEVRNLKVDDRLPMLFLDEFDSSPENYGMLLPLLWDGAITLKQKTLKLGRLIVVMAGSNTLLPEALDYARSMKGKLPPFSPENAKLVDLFSRINGTVISFPSLNSLHGEQYRAFDKVAICVQLIRRRFPTIKWVPIAFLRFVGRLQFRYDVRSITRLVDMINVSGGASADSISLKDMPIEFSDLTELRKSSLVYHLIDDKDNAHGIVKLWKSVSDDDAIVSISPTSLIPYENEAEAKISMAFALSSIDKTT